MGIVQRQSFQSSLIGYFGVIIGGLSTLYIYPNALEVYGLYRSLFDAAVLVSIFVLLGSTVSAVKFFPRYEDKSTGHQGLLTWSITVVSLGFFAFLLLYPWIQPILKKYVFNSINEQYSDTIIYLIPLTFFISFINLFSRYISNFKQIAIPAAFEQLVIKFTLPVIIILFLREQITVSGVMLGVVLSFGFSMLGLMYYLYYLGEWKLTKPSFLKRKEEVREYIRYSSFGMLANVGSQVAFRMDGLMVASMINFEAAGVYAVGWALSEMISKPMRSLVLITSPLLAGQIERNDWHEVENIYRKSSVTMLIVGFGLFMGLWTIVPYLFDIMANSAMVEKGKYVVLFLGLAQVWDMVTGVNSEIIAYSRYYRINLWLLIFLSVFNLAANYFLIPLYGITGSALATCLSLFLFNAAKLLFIKHRLGIQPFTIKHIPIVLFGLLAWIIASVIPDFGNKWVDLISKGFYFAWLFGLSIYFTRMSPDINSWINKLLVKIGIKPYN